MAGPETADAPDAQDASDSRTPHWLRPAASWVLAVLASVAIATAVLTVWVHQTLLDTESFVGAVEPALESEAVQDAMSAYLAEQVVTALDIENRVDAIVTDAGDALADALADALDLSATQRARLEGLDLGLSGLGEPISAGLETRIRDRIDGFVSDPAFTDALLEVVTVAHERTVHLLRDELDQLPNVVISDGEVRLNLIPLVAAAIRNLIDGDDVGIDGDVPAIAPDEEPSAAVSRLGAALESVLPPDFAQVPLMTTDRLDELQGMLRTLDRLVWAIVLVAIGLAIATIATAPSIGAGVVRVSAGGAIGLVIGLLAIRALAAWVTDAVQSQTGAAALDAVTSSLVANLQPLIILLAIGGFGAAVAAHLAQSRSGSAPEAGEG